jgi:ketosteroid isomerase-like protein
VRGRPAIEGFFKTDFAARKYTLTEIMPSSFDARTNSEASEIGTYHDMHDANGVKDHEWGRYLVALMKDTDGQWRLAYLIAFADSTKVEK